MNDLNIYQEAERHYKAKYQRILKDLNMDPLPDELMNDKDPNTVAGRGYGYNQWQDLFNYRQRLALMTFIDKIREAYKKIINTTNNEEHAKTITCYLSLALDRLASFSTNLCRWKNTTEQNIPVFSGRNALPMVFDYFEVNTIGEISNGWINCVATMLEPLPNLSQIKKIENITNSSATSLPFPNNFFDAIFTDPPYYDNINFAELSDFFYVLLKRSIGDLYPDYFSTPLVPKSQEIVANPIRQGGKDEAKLFFEENLKLSFKEIYRTLKPNGITTIVYAHKSTSGWETVINALLDSDLVVTACYPLNTEMKSKLNAQETASLMSSIYIVARKKEREKTGFYNEIREEIRKHLNIRLQRLWEEGISGADFFISGIGSAIEVFGKYEKVMDYEGNIIRADKLLADVREMVTNYAIKQILHNGFSGEITRTLQTTGYGRSEAFFRVAQAISETLPNESKEKKLLDGFLAGKERIKEDIRKKAASERLF